MRQEASQLKLSRENFSIDSSREQSLGDIENLKMEIIKRGTDLEQNKNSEIDISQSFDKRKDAIQQEEEEVKDDIEYKAQTENLNKTIDAQMTSQTPNESMATDKIKSRNKLKQNRNSMLHSKKSAQDKQELPQNILSLKNIKVQRLINDYSGGRHGISKVNQVAGHRQYSNYTSNYTQDNK